ncbi:phage distal tail protein [Streptomyces litchfieldiae]|uniref:Phage tail family protein n=1 Tax=Streptomyces litchfieldiae TaxID=3075543 RepID=A0ABU2MYQ0_9ACTN|nr:phage tail domain-containing protein [Streptomyces sp. DSM 44938]MDT0346755.1 phage tail family protein [Streptomyces sp. DSM 44938]
MTSTPPLDVAEDAAALAPGQIRYGALLLGRATPYRWTTLTGWEALPGLDSGTVLRSGAHGAHPGALLAQTRIVGLEDIVIRAEPGHAGEAVRQMRAHLAVTTDEQPLLVRLDRRGPLLAWVRPVRLDIPITPPFAVGIATGGAIEFEASDPRRYTPAEQTTATGLPEPCLDWHLIPGTTELRGTPASTGYTTATNAGDAPTHPVITLRGPVDTPSLTHTGTGAVLEYRLTLDPGECLVIDTYAGTVTTGDGTNALDTASPRSHPEHAFTLAPGENVLAFRANPEATPDPRAAADLRWRSAHW